MLWTSLVHQKNAISKLFRAQPFEIPRSAKRNLFKNLESEETTN